MHDHYQTVPVSSRCNLAHPKKLNSDYAKPSFLHYGADGETRTLTAFATAPSRRRVYQFHHVGVKNPVRGEAGGVRRNFKCARTRLTPPSSHLTPHLGMSFVLESASPAGLSGVGTGTSVAGATGTPAGACVAGCVAITPLDDPL